MTTRRRKTASRSEKSRPGGRSGAGDAGARPDPFRTRKPGAGGVRKQGHAARSPSPSVGGDDAAGRPWCAWLRAEAPRIEETLRSLVRRGPGVPASLTAAMRYSLFPGGKRLRPALVLLGHRACGGRDREIYRLAGCLELVHTFTLIHDDLPCMDDDDFRRGRPSCHKAFGEGLAILAGDALLNLAYEVVASLRSDPRRKEKILATLARAVGRSGVLGGQVDDLAAERRRIGEGALRSIHERKTASLIAASLRIGGEAAGGSARDLARLDRYGLELGHLFQIVDDMLNIEGTEAELGRPAGGDERRRKATYPRVIGRNATRRLLAARVPAVRGAARAFGTWSPLFDDLVRTVASRVRGGWVEGGA